MSTNTPVPPRAIPATYDIEPIGYQTVYQGPLECNSSTGTITCEAEMKIMSGVDPGMIIAFSDNVAGLEMIDVKVPGATHSAQCLIHRSTSGTSPSSEGSLASPLFVGDPDQVDEIRFHLVNFNRQGDRPVMPSKSGFMFRSEIRLGDWSVEIDSQPGLQDLLKNLKPEHKFGLTHTGRLRRHDGESFSFDDADDALQGLSVFLSYCRGLWVAPHLCVGLLNGEERCRELWSMKNTPNTNTYSFGQFLTDTDFQRLATGFWQRWSDEDQQGVILLAVHWYVESCLQNGSTEGSIVFIQSALEMLAWATFVEPATATITREDFANTRLYNAARKVRMLMTGASISDAIPAKYGELIAEATRMNWPAYPEVLAYLRNGLAHADVVKRRAIRGFSPDTVFEAWQHGSDILCTIIGHYLDDSVTQVYRDIA